MTGKTPRFFRPVGIHASIAGRIKMRSGGGRVPIGLPKNMRYERKPQLGKRLRKESAGNERPVVVKSRARAERKNSKKRVHRQTNKAFFVSWQGEAERGAGQIAGGFSGHDWVHRKKGAS